MSAVREYLVVRPLRARTRGTEAQAENQQYLMDIGFEAMLGGTSKGDEHDYDAVETAELVVHDGTGDGGLGGVRDKHDHTGPARDSVKSQPGSQLEPQNSNEHDVVNAQDTGVDVTVDTTTTTEVTMSPYHSPSDPTHCHSQWGLCADSHPNVEQGDQEAAAAAVTAADAGSMHGGVNVTVGTATFDEATTLTTCAKTTCSHTTVTPPEVAHTQ